jgi:uncharacterized protein (DUF362 family)
MEGYLMKNHLTRREFMRRTAAYGAGIALTQGSLAGRLFGAAGLDFYTPPIDLAVVTGDSPVKNCLAAVEALGGFGKFVRSGDKVVVKPNPVGSNRPERAINTHPEMIEAVVRECFAVGAKSVIVLSNDEIRSFNGNGTTAAVERAGGTVKPIQEKSMFREIIVPRGRILKRVEIASDILDADVFINMPIAKHHAGSRITGAMKNLMGANWDRQYFHATDLHQCIAELTSAVKHSLVIMDANHVLLTNGPVGPGQVLTAKQVIAGVDPVAVDAFSTRFWNLEPGVIPHIKAAYEIGAGEMNLDRLQIKEIAA